MEEAKLSAHVVQLGPKTSMTIYEPCYATSPCKHNVEIKSPLDTQNHLLTALQICEMYGSAALRPPPHFMNQLMKVASDRKRAWAPKRIGWL